RARPEESEAPRRKLTVAALSHFGASFTAADQRAAPFDKSVVSFRFGRRARLGCSFGPRFGQCHEGDDSVESDGLERVSHFADLIAYHSVWTDDAEVPRVVGSPALHFSGFQKHAGDVRADCELDSSPSELDRGQLGTKLIRRISHVVGTVGSRQSWLPQPAFQRAPPTFDGSIREQGTGDPSPGTDGHGCSIERYARKSVTHEGVVLTA